MKKTTLLFLVGALACAPDATDQPALTDNTTANEENDREPTRSDGNEDAGPSLEPMDSGEAPVLQEAEARMSGRYGLDLWISLRGSDADADATALWMRYLDDQNEPVPYLDSDDDGILDVADAVMPFDEPIHGLPEFSASFTDSGFFVAPGAIAKIEIALEDAAGHRSNTQTLNFIEQPVLGFGDTCDPTHRRDRCESGFGCRGEPATCLEGLPPTITRFAYLSNHDERRILVEGNEPDDDMYAVHLEFFDENDEAAYIDLDGDGTTDTATFDAFPVVNEFGSYFVELYPITTSVSQVVRIAATPVDAFGNEGERVVTELDEILERDWNQGCDPRGFDVCTSMATCVPGVVGASNKCGAPNQARQGQCEDAVTLYAPDGNLEHYGYSNGTSLWEPSSDCVNESGFDAPEEVVILELSRGLPSLTLSTDFPNTDFDTVLYVMEGICPAPGANARYLGCVDDSAEGLRSTLSLSNVPAGQYLVIVDAYGSRGGNYRLSVTTD